MLQLKGDDFVQTLRAVDVQVVASVLKVIGKNKTHQSEVMVSVEMADKNMVYPVRFHAVAEHLHLGGLAAVD